MNPIKKLFKSREITSVLFLVALYGIVGMINPAFLSATSISACFNSAVVYTIIAMGTMMTTPPTIVLYCQHH